jgi:predicted TIM-barrel fold metal-dependent hydrolase
VIDVSVLASARVGYGIDDARRELAQHGIGRGLLALRTARHELANERVLSAADDRLLPVATLNPVQYLDWPSELERVLAEGAVALRFFPDVQGWSVDSAPFQAMRRRIRVPLLLPVDRFGDATAIGAATAGHDAVVLVGAHYSQLGDCLAALEQWPHLYLETSRLAHFRAIETIVRNVGAGRVLFGSGAPTRPVQAALNMVLRANIAADEQRAILGGNAASVFGLPEPRFDLPAPTVGTGLIDVHGHFGALGLPTPLISPIEQTATAAAHGIARTVASSLQAIADDVGAGNADVLAAVTDQLRAYVVVDPHDLDGSCRALDAAYARDEAAALGAKLHCSYARSPTASRACVALLHAVAERGRPLLIHVDGPDWDTALTEVANAHPRWKTIIAHGGPGTPVRAAACVVERTTNVYVELSTSFPDLPVVREVVGRVGAERLLFGSDAPLLDAAYALGLYADAGADLVATTRTACKVFDW